MKFFFRFFLFSVMSFAACATYKSEVYQNQAIRLSGLRIGVMEISGFNNQNASSEVTTQLLKLGCNVYERNKINILLEEHEFQLSGIVDEETAIRVGKLIGLNAIFVGSVSQPTESRVANMNDNTWLTYTLTFTGRIINVEDGSIIASGKSNASRGYPDRALSDAIVRYFQELR